MEQQFLPPESSSYVAVPPVETVASAVLTEAETQANEQTFLELTAKAQRRIHRRRWKMVRGSVIYLAIITLFLYLDRIYIHSPHHDDPLYVAYPMAAVLLSFFTCQWWWPSELKFFSADDLARLGGVRAIPVLLEAIDFQVPLRKQLPIFKALIRLLPLMKSSDASLLTERHRRLLIRHFAIGLYAKRVSAVSIELRLTILKAYEQIGGVQEIPAVEYLAKMNAKSAQKTLIKEAALACLPYLRANAGLVTDSALLLRPSSAEAAKSETLLRPASATNTTPPNELLRVPDGENGKTAE